MTIAFWILCALIIYVYLGYPLLLVLMCTMHGRRPVARGPCEVGVTLVVSAYNEEASIRAKIENSLGLDYPSERLQIIVVSDASDDGTDSIVQEFAAQGVELLRMPERGGKTAGLNAAITRCRGPVVVFSDANAIYARDGLDKLVRNFADPRVGAVIGESGYADIAGAAERSEGLYWRYETWLKRLESSTGSVVGGDGAIYAIRRELYQPMRPDALSDFVNPLQIVRAGYRCVYEPDAHSYERAAGDFRGEFRRKVRIVNRAWRALFSMAGLLNPFRYGFFSIALLSHKLLRWLVPIPLAVLFALGVALSNVHVIYRAVLVAQIVFYLLALVGWMASGRPALPSFLAIPYYFCLVNVASLFGIADAFRGRTYTTWTTARPR